MRIAVLAAAAALCAGAANAEQTTAQASRQSAGQEGRVIYVCDRSEETRRGFAREHGQLTFVSASELARAEAAKETWSSPRCITEVELERYEKAMETARVQRTNAAR